MSETPPVGAQPEPELPLEHRQWRDDRNRSLAQREHDKFTNAANKFNEYANDGSVIALRAGILINGGAAIAVLTFIGGLVQKGKVGAQQLDVVAGSLMWFAAGVAGSTAALACAYFYNYFAAGLQQTFSYTWEHPYVQPTPKTRRYIITTSAFQIVAIVCGIGALVVFVIGMIAVRNSLPGLAVI